MCVSRARRGLNGVDRGWAARAGRRRRGRGGGSGVRWQQQPLLHPLGGCEGEGGEEGEGDEDGEGDGGWRGTGTRHKARSMALGTRWRLQVSALQSAALRDRRHAGRLLLGMHLSTNYPSSHLHTPQLDPAQHSAVQSDCTTVYRHVMAWLATAVVIRFIVIIVN